MIFFFKKNNLNSGRIYSVYPHHFDKTFMRLLNLLSDEDILLTFNERDMLYDKFSFIINFLEKKKKEQHPEPKDVQV